MKEFIEFVENARTLLKEKYGCKNLLENTAKRYRLSDFITMEDEHCLDDYDSYVYTCDKEESLAMGTVERRTVYNGNTQGVWGYEADKHQGNRHAYALVSIAGLPNDKFTEQDKIELILTYVFCTHLTHVQRNSIGLYSREDTPYDEYRSAKGRASRMIDFIILHSFYLRRPFMDAQTRRISIFTESLREEDLAAFQKANESALNYAVRELGSFVNAEFSLLFVEEYEKFLEELNSQKDRLSYSKERFDYFKKPERKEECKKAMQDAKRQIKKLEKYITEHTDEYNQTNEKVRNALGVVISTMFEQYIYLAPKVLFENEVLLCYVLKYADEWQCDRALTRFSEKLYGEKEDLER